MRYHGRGAWLANPLWPAQCALCGSHLVTGRRDLVDTVRGRIRWTGVYVVHAFAGFGILTVGAGLLWPDIINQPIGVRFAPEVSGVILGLGLAEWSRRTGTLLGHSKRSEGRGPSNP